MKKRFVALFLVVICMFCLSAEALAFRTIPTYQLTFPKVTTSYSNIRRSAEPIRHEYSSWHRVTYPVMASQEGEPATFRKEDTKTVEVTASIGLSIPIKELELSFGLDKSIQKSQSVTVYGHNSRGLRINECAAYYYRDHWAYYSVSYDVTTTKTVDHYDGIHWRHEVESVSTVGECGLVKVPVVGRDSNGNPIVRAEDRSWFYADSEDALTEELDRNYPRGATVASNFCPLQSW